LIVRVFCVRRVFRGSIFCLFSTDSTYSHVPGDKGGPFCFRLKNFCWCSFYIQIGVLQFVSCVQFLREIECIKFVRNKFVLVLVQIDLIQFESSNCIKSIYTKTNTNSIHTNLIHSILRKNQTFFA
jgi:hypothetical protein